MWLNGVPPLQVRGTLVDLGWLGSGLATLYLVWLINLTNFMDGIDGIAAVECITVSFGGVLLYVLSGPSSLQWLMPLMLASACLGFLVWNWPPAKIFMGDVGSGFLGFMLAALSLQAARLSPRLFWGWVILLGIFVVDATFTLLRRIMRGERFYEAHRTHAYQYAARRFGHRPVTLAVARSMPVAAASRDVAASGAVDGLIGVVIAYVPLCAAAIWFRAGQPPPRNPAPCCPILCWETHWPRSVSPGKLSRMPETNSPQRLSHRA